MKNSSKILFFDKGCRLCAASANFSAKIGLAHQDQINSLQEIREEILCDIDQSRYCNELAVHDSSTKETRYGVEGIVWFLEEKWGKWINFLLWPVVFQIVNFFYKLFAYNRRLIVPTYDKVEGDCAPKFHWGFRVAYMLLVLLVIWMIGGWLSLLFIAVPPVLFFIFSLRLIPEKMEFLGHLATIILFQFALIFVLTIALNIVLLLGQLGTIFMFVFFIITAMIFYPFSYLIYSKRIRHLAMDHRLVMGFSLSTFFLHLIFLYWFIYQVI